MGVVIANHKGIMNAAGGFLTSYIQRNHHKKIGAFVRRVSISCIFALNWLYYKSVPMPHNRPPSKNKELLIMEQSDSPSCVN